jgi:peptidyl-prolyl cis-trans isomerase D
MPIETSGFFGREQPYLKAGWSMETIQKIFQMAQGQTSEPIETAQSFQVLRVKDKKDSYIPDYDEVKEKVKEAWMLQEAKKIAKEKAAEDSKLIKEKFDSVKYPDFTAIAKELKFEIYQTPVFSRGQYLPAIGISKDFQNAAFALNAQNPLSDLVESVKGWCILHLDASFPADMENYDKEKGALGEALLSEQRNAAFNDFLIRLRLKANLEDNVSKRKAGRRE